MLVWAALIAYLVWATRSCTSRERDVPAGEIRVTILDSAQLQIVTPRLVGQWIADAGLIPLNISAREIPVGKIEQLLRRQEFVRSADLYVDMQGVTHITISQRRPLLRLRTIGYDCYLSADGRVLPLQPHLAMRLPVVTGDWMPPFEHGFTGPLDLEAKNSPESAIFLDKLINFVEFIRRDDFWSSFIEQIELTDGRPEPRIRIIPRTDNHLVALGTLDDYPDKLEKLLAFYRGALDYEGWSTYRMIDLSYKDQIVCTQ